MEEKTVDRRRGQGGQTLVLVALLFVGLLVFAGIAIDGGNVYAQRRQAQNAADAAALAGTRLIAEAMQTCDSLNLFEHDLRIARIINDYAEQNGIPDTHPPEGDEFNDNVVGYYVDPELNILGTVGLAGTLPDGTSGVRVEVAAVHETFFMPVIDIDTIPSSATATAMTGRIMQMPPGAPLLPIGVPEAVVDGLPPGFDWIVHDNLDARFCYTDEYGVEQCIGEEEDVTQSQRAWLNLNHIFNNEYLAYDDSLNRTFEKSPSADKCPADPLKKLSGLPGYASGGCPYPHPIIAGTSGYMDEDFVHGSSGAESTGVQAIYEGYAGKTAMAPVFDVAYKTTTMVDTFDPQAECPDGYSNGGGFSSAGGGGDAYYYHVVGYTAFTVGTPEGNEVHDVYGSFVTAVIAGGFLPEGYSGGQCTSFVYGIGLWD